jgi:hypothetical protein
MAKTDDRTVISIPAALRLVGIFAGSWAILVGLAATLAYLPGHPEFSFFTTYLSDIGDTAGWPQILWNSGALIAAPIRYAVIVLLVLRLGALGAGRAFTVAALVIGAISTSGTVLMTAVPFSVGPAIHKLGIPLYFLGVVLLQTLIGVSEWRLRGVPKILPVLCFVVVIVFFIFAGLVTLYGRGMVGRETPVIWEWLAFFTSVVWVFAQSILLGKVDKR